MKNTAYFFIIAIGTILALKVGQNMLVQLIIAFLLWFATVQLRKTACKLTPFDRFVPNKLKSIVILTGLLLVVYLVLHVVTQNLSDLLSSFGKYEGNINNISTKIEKLLDINLEQELKGVIGSLDIKNMLSQLASTLSGLFSKTFMILIYLLFIFLEADSIRLKFDVLFPDADKKQRVLAIWTKIETSLSSYFRVKTLMSVLTGFLSYLVLLVIGVDSAIFWAFLIFLLNYIPTIGSLVATAFPAVFSLLQFGTFMPCILVLGCIATIQQIVGNLIEPKLMGKNLNVSPMVTIIALGVWGQLWGIIGMLLSVPITVIIIIVLSQFQSTQTVAILLSEKGELSKD